MVRARALGLHPAVDTIVRIVTGKHAGEVGQIIGTHPPTAHVTVQVGQKVMDVAAADIEFTSK
jgi:hypothetical protein